MAVTVLAHSTPVTARRSGSSLMLLPPSPATNHSPAWSHLTLGSANHRSGPRHLTVGPAPIGEGLAGGLRSSFCTLPSTSHCTVQCIYTLCTGEVYILLAAHQCFYVQFELHKTSHIPCIGALNKTSGKTV